MAIGAQQTQVFQAVVLVVPVNVVKFERDRLSIPPGSAALHAFMLEYPFPQKAVFQLVGLNVCLASQIGLDWLSG